MCFFFGGGRAWWVAQQSTYCNKWIHFLLYSLSVVLLSGCIARPKASAMLRTGCLAHPEVAMHCNADSSGHVWMQGNWCCKMGSIVCRYCGYKYDAVTERAICSLSKLANPAIHHAIQPKQACLPRPHAYTATRSAVSSVSLGELVLNSSMRFWHLLHLPASYALTSLTIFGIQPALPSPYVV